MKNLKQLLTEAKPDNQAGLQADLNAKILERSQVNSGNLLTGGRKRRAHTRSRRNRRNTKKNRKNRA